MSDSSQPLDTLRDIKQMMERSSRFISLSGLSGIAAGCCALVGAWFANRQINAYRSNNGAAFSDDNSKNIFHDVKYGLPYELIKIAVLTFVAALILAFIFTYLRSRKNKSPLWSNTSRRLMFNVCIPLLVGGIYMLNVLRHGAFELVASGCLIFYGLALVNASKYTLSEIRYLGYGQLLLGLLDLAYDDSNYGLYFWALGFGVLHILYGAIMWWKYERNQA